MVQYVHESALKPGFEGHALIDSDHPCRSCGYNLRGLKRSGTCPECGTPIHAPRAALMSFCDLPPATIGRFMPGFVLAAMSVTGVATLRIGARFTPWNAMTEAQIIAGTAALWFLSTCLITAPIELPDGVSRGFSTDSTLRRLARWLQLGWLATSLVALYAAYNPTVAGPTLTTMRAISMSSELAGAVGVILLCVLLSRFAEWMQDDFAEHCFDLAFGGLAIITPVVFIIIPFFKTLLPIVLILGTLLGGLWLLCLAAFPVGLWSLSRSLGWSAIHSHDKLARARREHARLAPQVFHPAQPVHENLSAPIPVSEGPVPPRTIEHAGLKAIDDGAGSHDAAGGIHRRPYVHDEGDSSGHGGESHGGVI